MQRPSLRAGLVGFGEVNSPRELIARKCAAAQAALEAQGVEVLAAGPVSDEVTSSEEAQAIARLRTGRFDLLVACVAGWIPSQTIINVLEPFRHLPIVLWGLTGEYVDGRLITTADQAGTSAVRDTLDALGYRFWYVYDTPDRPYAQAARVAGLARVAQAAASLRGSRVGMMGYRDMHLYATLVDGVSLRRLLGVEVESFDTLEMVQQMERLDAQAVADWVTAVQQRWQWEGEPPLDTVERGVRLYLALQDKVRERTYSALSLVDVYGVKKLLGFTPAMTMMLLMDEAGVAAIPENDGLGAVTQLLVRGLTGQVGAYFEFYEFMADRVLVGVPDFVPAEVVEGPVRVRPCQFGSVAGVLNISRVKPGRVTLCRLASRGDRYRLHVVTGEAFTPQPWEEAGWAPPAPQLPSLEVVLDTPVDEFAQQVLGQHYILAYGDCRQQLGDICKLLGIEEIS